MEESPAPLQQNSRNGFQESRATSRYLHIGYSKTFQLSQVIHSSDTADDFFKKPYHLLQVIWHSVLPTETFGVKYLTSFPKHLMICLKSSETFVWSENKLFLWTLHFRI